MTVQTGRFRLYGVRKMRHESTPWLYPRNDRRYAGKGAYTLLIHYGGFMHRVYDFEGRPFEVAS